MGSEKLGHRRAGEGEHDGLGSIRAFHTPLPRVLLALDLDLPACRVPIPNAGQLADGALVREPGHLSGLETLPQAADAWPRALAFLRRHLASR